MKSVMKVFMTIINEEKKYWELKQSIRMMNSQRKDSEINLIEQGKKIGINEVVKDNEMIKNSLKPLIWNGILLREV